MNKTPLTVRFAHWLLRKHEAKSQQLGINLVAPKVKASRMDQGRDTVNFTVHPASGGYVVESSYYDEKNDRHNRHLHIITSQENFSEELGKAVFMDMLKNR